MPTSALKYICWPGGHFMYLLTQMVKTLSGFCICNKYVCNKFDYDSAFLDIVRVITQYWRQSRRDANEVGYRSAAKHPFRDNCYINIRQNV